VPAILGIFKLQSPHNNLRSQDRTFRDGRAFYYRPLYNDDDVLHHPCDVKVRVNEQQDIKPRILAQLGLPPGKINLLLDSAQAPKQIEPTQQPALDMTDATAVAAGEELLRQGKAALLLAAGGSGTRLGYNGPKGCYAIGPKTDRTLFSIHIGKLIYLQKRYGALPHAYILTSPDNINTIKSAFAANDHYGMDPDHIHFFPQGVFPALDKHGNFFWRSRGELATFPDGTGGIYAALRQARLFEQMQQAGVEVLNYIQVDNPLAPILDPGFLGRHQLEGADYSALAVQRRSATERVGTFARINGQLGIVEYTEIDPQIASSKTSRGELVFPYASPGIFAFDRRYTEEMTEQSLPLHVAFKKVPIFDPDTGKLIDPLEPNGYKLERYIFDAFPFAKKGILVKGERDSHFAPVKNASGKDSPEECQSMMVAEYKRWMATAGVTTTPSDIVEFDPRDVASADDLK